MNYDENGGWHKGFIRMLAQRMRPKCFIELGLATEPAILECSEFCENAYGVDHAIVPKATPPNATILRMTTDQFFADVAPTIPAPELVFIDADHSKEAVLSDFRNVEKIAADNCIVLLHDTFPPNAQFTAPDRCGDSYLVPKLLGCEHVTLPFPPGLTLCRLKPRNLF